MDIPTSSPNTSGEQTSWICRAEPSHRPGHSITAGSAARSEPFPVVIIARYWSACSPAGRQKACSAIRTIKTIPYTTPRQTAACCHRSLLQSNLQSWRDCGSLVTCWGGPGSAMSICQPSRPPERGLNLATIHLDPAWKAMASDTRPKRAQNFSAGT